MDLWVRSCGLIKGCWPEAYSLNPKPNFVLSFFYGWFACTILQGNSWKAMLSQLFLVNGQVSTRKRGALVCMVLPAI